ncbi:uracil-DNA glycosylase [Paralysiella testudinis]|uniref:Uracil-DNA glycosylase n=1 Tax=Paralysiella testudinis TaxID=2809020 RepID=A0A892ZK16_9NEIS|nr:uracil-DNA glycosylase [Paralysiella testudinis]QRQ82973.1 uracil-DNA glycosylase [Paralysiella testudinis]
MLSSRYLHLHEALGLGPMWLQQGAQVLPPPNNNRPADNHPPAADTSSAAAAPTPAHHSNKSAHARQAVMAAVGGETKAPPATPAPSAKTAPSAVAAPIPIDTLSPATLPTALAQCQRCDLHRQRRQPLPGHGSLQAKLLVISPNPAPEDDMAAQLFSGEAGVLLHNMLAAIHIDPAAVYFTSQVKCTPNATLQVNPTETAACTPFLQQQIAWLQPQAVLLLGQSFQQMAPDTLAELLQQRPYVIVPHPARLLRQHQLKAEAWQALQKLVPMLSA